MDVFKVIDIERVVTIILFVCLALAAIFLVVSGIGIILKVRLEWAMIACLVFAGLATLCCVINALLNL